MKMEQFKEKIKSFCQRVGKRNFIIIGSVVLIAAAIAINVAVFSRTDEDGFDYDQSAGMDGDQLDAGTEAPDESESDVDTYFSGVQVSRQRSRDEAIEVLQSVDTFIYGPLCITAPGYIDPGKFLGHLFLAEVCLPSGNGLLE